MRIGVKCEKVKSNSNNAKVSFVDRRLFEVSTTKLSTSKIVFTQLSSSKIVSTQLSQFNILPGKVSTPKIVFTQLSTPKIDNYIHLE